MSMDSKIDHLSGLNETETFDFPIITMGDFDKLVTHLMQRDIRAIESYEAKVKAGETPTESKRIPPPILVLGKAGIGKTEIIRGVAQKLGIGFREMRLVNYTEIDLVGIPFENENHMTEHAANDLFPWEERDGKYGILLIDEFTSATRQVQVPILQLTDVSRSVGHYKLPDGWKVIIAGNGPDDGGTFNNLPGTVISRASCFYAISQQNAWLSWAYEKGIHPVIRAYIKYRPSDLHAYKSDEDYDRAFPCPRSWCNLSTVLTDYDQSLREGGVYDPDMLSCLVAAYVGRPTAERFIAFEAFRKDILKPEEILKNTDAAKKCHLHDMKKEEVRWLTVTSLATKVRELMDSYFSKRLKEGKGRPTIDEIMRDKYGVLLINAFNWVSASSADKTANSLVAAELIQFAMKELISANGFLVEFTNSKEFATQCPNARQYLDSSRMRS